MTDRPPATRPPLRLRAPEPREAEAHRQILAVCRLALPAGAVVLHVPNGMEASAAAWNRVHGLGAVAGVFDLLILYDGRACWLEVKRHKEVLSAVQRDFGRALTLNNIPWAVVHDGFEAYDALKAFGLPLRRMHFDGNARGDA